MFNVGYQKRELSKLLTVFSDPGLRVHCCIIHLGFQELICCSDNSVVSFPLEAANVILVLMFGHTLKTV